MPLMSAFTCKIHQFARAPKLIELLGDKKRPEPAQHVIEFPGGAIEVSRTENGDYWAHIHIHHGQPVDDCEGLVSECAEVIETRFLHDSKGFLEVPEKAGISQIAVLVHVR